MPFLVYMKNDIFSYLKEIFLRNRRMTSGCIGKYLLCQRASAQNSNYHRRLYEKKDFEICINCTCRGAYSAYCERPGALSANSTAASTLGSMEPGAKCPSPMYLRAASGVRESSHFSSGLPKLMATFSTAVRMIRVSASTC